MAISNATLHAKQQTQEKRIDDLAANSLSNAAFLSHLSKMARVSDSTSTLSQVTTQFNLLVDRLISGGYMS